MRLRLGGLRVRGAQPSSGRGSRLCGRCRRWRGRRQGAGFAGVAPRRGARRRRRPPVAADGCGEYPVGSRPRAAAVQGQRGAVLRPGRWRRRPRTDRLEPLAESPTPPARQPADAIWEASPEAEEKTKKEADEQAKREAEARAKNEAEEKAKREAEAKAKREAEETAKSEAGTQVSEDDPMALVFGMLGTFSGQLAAGVDEEEKAAEKTQKEADEKAKREAEAKAKSEAEEKAKREAEAKAKQEAEETAKRDARSQVSEDDPMALVFGMLGTFSGQLAAGVDEEEKAAEKTQKEADEKAKREAEAKAKSEAEEKAKREAEAKAKQEAEETAKRDARSQVSEDAAVDVNLNHPMLISLNNALLAPHSTCDSASDVCDSEMPSRRPSLGSCEAAGLLRRSAA
ncbi:unnamed protein product [Prorocentrum cordatum]|uniref:Uncharacterized protein n=1 Tax=Prorocentrum cordatum TaxID=2364126 RepID=A0ABN9RAP2_9DINO|nr:unnamed protein product [Polarella glacialis]